MDHYNGLATAIVTAADEKYARLLLDLCDSLGPWSRYLHVLDGGLNADTRGALERRNIEVHHLPDSLFAGLWLPENYLRLMYARPRLPAIIPAEILMWIDADCWVQRPEAITTYLDSAAKYSDDFTLCVMLDVEYPRCVDNYWQYLETYSKKYRALYGRKVANSLLGKAVLSSGVFAAHRLSPMWRAWQIDIAKCYSSRVFRKSQEIRFMAEMICLNAVLHLNRGYRLLSSEFNWACHCSDAARDGDVVRIRPSGRIPAIVHLSDLKSPGVEARYRENRLFYERPKA